MQAHRAKRRECRSSEHLGPAHIGSASGVIPDERVEHLAHRFWVGAHDRGRSIDVADGIKAPPGEREPGVAGELPEEGPLRPPVALAERMQGADLAQVISQPPDERVAAPESAPGGWRIDRPVQFADLLSAPFLRAMKLPAGSGVCDGVWQERVPDVLMAEGEGTGYQPFYLVAVSPGREGCDDAEPGLSRGSDDSRRPDGGAEVGVRADEQGEVGAGGGRVRDQGYCDVDVGLLLFVRGPGRAAVTALLLLGLVPAVDDLQAAAALGSQGVRYASWRACAGGSFRTVAVK